ncbi:MULTISPECIES: DUF4148 domain-containing protein [unclassified Burkholderia]|uniref:DUF4148 domain-containing protein n=1 Tax=unclassified Burkholderia TaxID=2613784 RepID=UPI000F573AC2|nr:MULTISPECIES: DUF4148 domain-containing protein [unclassified Burkholderia]RQR44278.1 DUF4148 domain-containing protein [Burkholderia sp. Bp9131]RQR71100.1 DUF4148 domain-containing protein [Burkholderia sp. Bp9015]RQR80542.1 DUF4148 domain-containing protein [Burkholderia sp. Bp9011]RQR89990.1 DUF4148 domain-containing protein [Burkholderia sp. Bp9010]RQR97576.1 DUF4148 domain-containing protein [Burkholderia sp. Bp8994]
MKAARILAVAVLASIPVLSFADAGHGLTRADVRADLVRLEQAGYNPAGSDARYPDDIAAAQNVIAAQQVARSDQNGPSKSQDDNVAAASAPASRYAAADQRAARNARTDADDLYAHS